MTDPQASPAALGPGRLLLGVTGGIAAYKACELVSLAMKVGWQVEVIMTANATRFVGPLTFAGLTGRPVHLGTFDDAMAHIQLAKWADVALIAPLSANVLGKLACGLADDLLTTTILALPRGKRCVLAPAMNTEMWRSPVVQRNIRWIDELGGYDWVQPTEKRLACGDFGVGALAEPTDILTAVYACVNAHPSLPR
ncbi:MAG: phosphopantothenoylcysteine decarboxylase [Myxococcales bacterium]|nr:phosphopantothenoylcysteine decarboxylase [Myxococcales bacterium]